MSQVFLSYRRDDQPALAYLLKDRIEARIGRGTVFLDISGSLSPGDDFEDRIKVAISRSDVFISLIGPNWLGSGSATETSRILLNNDFVRLENELALTADKDIIPVLIEPAEMPTRDQLPPTIWPLLKKQAVALSLRSIESACREIVDSCVHRLEKAAERRAVARGEAESMIVSRVLQGKEISRELAVLARNLDFSQKEEFLSPALCDGVEINLLLLRLCENLERIDISHSENRSLDGLSQLKKLKRIRIRRSKIVDIGDAADILSLEYLYAFKSRILRDLSPLKNHPNLIGVYLAETAVLDLEAISTCANLRQLDLSKTQISDFMLLSHLENLEYLALVNTKFDDLNLLSSNRNLAALEVALTSLKTLKGLENLKNLTTLNIRFLRIRDFSPLYALTNLKKLFVDKKQIVDQNWLRLNNVSVDSGGC
jgi:Leucine-rich repeat (LRR) protein